VLDARNVRIVAPMEAAASIRGRAKDYDIGKLDGRDSALKELKYIRGLETYS
jgi:hypothetical protein